MKVLHVTPFYEPAWKPGGVVRAVSQLCRGLAGLGVDVTVYATNGSGDGWLDVPVNQLVSVGGVKVYYFQTELPQVFRYCRALREVCRRTIRNFDILHIASFWNYPGIPAAMEARKQGIPYVISTHGTLVAYALRKGRLKKWLYMKAVEERNLRSAAAIHYTTKLEREAMSYLRLPNPTFVVPNGLDFREFDTLPERNIARKCFGLPEDYFVMSYLGRLNKIKGLDILVQAFAKIARRFPETLLLLAGPNDGYEPALRKLVSQFGLYHQIRFVGPVNPEMRAHLLSATDLSLSLSLSETENFCYAAVEAMAAGVPLMLSKHVGISREVEADGAGVVVSPEVEAEASTLAELLSQPARLKEMGKAARLSARKRYDIGVVARFMATAYEDILTGRRSPECKWLMEEGR